MAAARNEDALKVIKILLDSSARTDLTDKVGHSAQDRAKYFYENFKALGGKVVVKDFLPGWMEKPMSEMTSEEHRYYCCGDESYNAPGSYC